MKSDIEIAPEPKHCTFPRCGCPQQCAARAMQEHIRLRRALRVPNRLLGVVINEDGDAV